MRASKRYPLTAVGDVNTYAIFAETFLNLPSKTGRSGFIVPTGIATDNSTKAFFDEATNKRRLVSLLDFENREHVFPGIDSRIKFCRLALGSGVPATTFPEDYERFAKTFPKVDLRVNVSFVDAGKFLTLNVIGQDGKTTVLKQKLALQAGEVIDATFMSKRALRQFLEEQIEDANKQGVLFSLHMKATMMKISDPKIFGHAVTVYYKDVFEKHAETLKKLGVDPDNGIGDLYLKIKALPDDQRKAIEADVQEIYKKRPPMAMVNSDKGITNLHVPSDIIIDASMPPVIRDSGKMWNPEGKLQDTKCVIPDSSYAPVYHEVVEFCKKYGAFDPKTMGSVPNVGLMAQAAEEYGSHDKTFKAPDNGTMRVVDASGKVLLEHKVEEGDIWRMCQVKDAPIQDWVKLAVNRAQATGAPAVFWLNTETPVTSVGSRSGVHWSRLNVQPTLRARARANMVLATPGTSSRRTCPSQK